MLGDLEKKEEGYVALLEEYELHSAFQPVISLSHNKVIGYEGLLRAFRAGIALSPIDFFQDIADKGLELGDVDRTCRVIHMLNASPDLNQDPGWIFLNVDSRTLFHDLRSASVLRDSLERIGLAPENIVLEIVEKKVEDNDMLQRFVNHYRDAGFRIAVDDFGAEEANFERIAVVKPHIVKLDRSIIKGLSMNRNGSSILRRIVSLLHEMGCLALVEGVETERQAELVMATDADFAQGYYYSRPRVGEPRLSIDVELEQKMDSLKHYKRSGLNLENTENMAFKDEMVVYFEKVKQKLIESPDAQLAAEDFPNSHIRRFYLLDEQGVQQGPAMVNPALDFSDLKQHPLAYSQGACWARRNYFANAMKYPGTVCFTDPYLSVPEEKAAVTFSASFQSKQGDTYVLCMDVDARAFTR